MLGLSSPAFAMSKHFNSGKVKMEISTNRMEISTTATTTTIEIIIIMIIIIMIFMVIIIIIMISGTSWYNRCHQIILIFLD